MIVLSGESVSVSRGCGGGRKQLMTKLAAVTILIGSSASFVGAQTRPTQAEIDKWKKEPPILENSECREINWAIEQEDHPSAGVANQTLRNTLGWWGRGFIEGAVFLDDRAKRAATAFGLSVDVVAAHLTSYCYQHPKDTPVDAAQDLLLKILR